MARTVNRGEIWTYRFKAPDKRRPVLVLSRQEVIELLHTVAYVGTLQPRMMQSVCRALAIATGCAD